MSLSLFGSCHSVCRVSRQAEETDIEPKSSVWKKLMLLFQKAVSLSLEFIVQFNESGTQRRYFVGSR